MNDESEFLAEIIANPRDLAPRLIFADWLEEQGNPRGEFIRIQCELANPSDDLQRREELDERQESLRRLHEREWTSPLQGKISGWTFHCGFIESVEVTAEQFLKHEKEIAELIPIRYLTIQRAHSRVAGMMNSKLLQQIEVLKFEHSPLTESDTGALVSVPFPQLQSLSLSNCRLPSESFDRMPQIQAANLRELDVSMNELRNSAVSLIVNSPAFADLTSLILFANNIRRRGASVLAGSEGLQKLQFLDIRRNPIGPQGVRVLLERFGRGLLF